MANILVAANVDGLAAFFYGLLAAALLAVVWVTIWLLSLLFQRERKSPEARQSPKLMLSVTAAFLVMAFCFALYVAHPMVTLLSVGAIVLLIHVAFEAMQPHAYSVRDLFVVMTVVAVVLGAIAVAVRR